jgi:hypothetical protein
MVPTIETVIINLQINDNQLYNQTKIESLSSQGFFSFYQENDMIIF